MKFDLRYEPWIPVRDKDNHIREVGILGLLHSAQDLSEITDQYPHQEFGMYRLMMTLLMDMYRPRKLSHLSKLLEEGMFDDTVIDGYFKECEQQGVSFDLFDENKPFIQVPYTDWGEKKEPGTAALLNPALPSGNNHIHFNHEKETETVLTFAEAARALCAVTAFCTPGAHGYPSTVNGAPPVYTIVKGKNLFETLIYGMTISNQYENYTDEPVLWKWNHKIEEKKEVISTSLLFGMTFPCRRITLIPEKDGSVRKVFFGQGMNFTGYTTFVDPYVSYVQGAKGRSNIKPRMEVEPWRNIATLLNCESKTAPLVVQQYKDLSDQNTIQINTYSVVTSNASYLDEFEGEYTLPISIIRSPVKIECLQMAIEKCEQEAKNLEAALKQLKILLGYRKDAKNMNGQIQNSISRFYSESKELFLNTLISVLSSEKVVLEEILKDWSRNIRIISLRNYDFFVENIGANAKLLLVSEDNRKKYFFKKDEVKKKNDKQ